jgi:hypothetical protein
MQMCSENNVIALLIGGDVFLNDLMQNYYNYIIDVEADLLLKLTKINDYTGKGFLENALHSIPRVGSRNVIRSDLRKWKELHHYLWEVQYLILVDKYLKNNINVLCF